MCRFILKVHGYVILTILKIQVRFLVAVVHKENDILAREMFTG